MHYCYGQCLDDVVIIDVGSVRLRGFLDAVFFIPLIHLDLGFDILYGFPQSATQLQREFYAILTFPQSVVVIRQALVDVVDLGFVCFVAVA